MGGLGLSLCAAGLFHAETHHVLSYANIAISGMALSLSSHPFNCDFCGWLRKDPPDFGWLELHSRPILPLVLEHLVPGRRLQVSVCAHYHFQSRNAEMIARNQLRWRMRSRPAPCPHFVSAYGAPELDPRRFHLGAHIAGPFRQLQRFLPHDPRKRLSRRPSYADLRCVIRRP